jgi:hypothetical protein
MAKALLGISPGTRIVGLAVMYKGELLEWKVKTFRERWSAKKQKAILATIGRLCDYHGIQAIAVKKVDPLRSSPQLDGLVAAIATLAEGKHIKLWQFSLSDLDYDVRNKKKQTKGDLSEQVADKHPELRRQYLRERNNRNDYHTKMFEAIAMAERGRDE